MKIPRDISGSELLKKLSRLGYTFCWQTGSHLICETELNGRHRISIPNHDPIKVGTLSMILSEVAAHHDITKQDVLELITGR
jgi:predicted RNA binding protein YcfA (HicA-like mRNA interferase family)